MRPPLCRFRMNAAIATIRRYHPDMSEVLEATFVAGCSALPYSGAVGSPLLRLPEPRLARSGPLPSSSGWSFELKWDGFRAIVSTANESAAGVRER